MRLVEKHIIKKGSEFYSECDLLCFKSKNLYNAANYVVRQNFINTSKLKEQGLVEHATYLNYYNINRLFVDDKQFDMYQLPLKVSNQTLMLLDKNWKSFFSSIKDYVKNPSKYKGSPSLPKYLNKTDGRYVVVYEAGAISKKLLKNGIIVLSKTNIQISSRKENINQVRIVPKLDQYVIEVIYTVPDVPMVDDNHRYASIDLGVNNLATITSNTKELKPTIINGKPLKSINQYYNKKLASLKSTLETRNKKKTSKNLRKLTNTRNNKVDNYLHKASKEVVKQLVDNNMSKLVIGLNKQWKTDSSMSVKSNQNFVQIPHSRFIEMITYKCERQGIRVILQEESYTSKASFLNLDKIPTYGDKNNQEIEFSGYRASRGLYKLKGSETKLNADVNGSYNILRKAIPTAFDNGIEGLSVNPVIIKITN